MPQPRKLHDAYFLKAKAEGYAARSAYKLLEIQEKKRLIRAGDRVLDLGCAPGSWLQVAARLAGPGGVVVGVDLKPVEIELPDHVHTLVADAFAIDPATLRGSSGKPFDVLLSDMAPSTSGHGDEFLSARLCERVLTLADALLRVGGNVCMKILEGEPTPAVLQTVRERFDEASMMKPPASRDVSRETFIVGRRFLGPRRHASTPQARPAATPDERTNA